MNEQSRKLSIEEWSVLADKNIMIPVHIVLHGISMEPLIRYEKDPVNILPVQAMGREFLPGDIVLFRRADGAYVVHRIYQIRKSEHKVQTWGDNCYAPDEPIDEECVLGLVISCEKKGKTIRLDTEEQRDYGRKWMNGSIRRKLWFRSRSLKELLRRIVKHVILLHR